MQFNITFFFIFISDGIQKFIEAPSPTEVSPDKDVVIRCKIQNRRGTCSWQKDNKVGIMVHFKQILNFNYR